MGGLIATDRPLNKFDREEENKRTKARKEIYKAVKLQFIVQPDKYNNI